MARYQIWNKKDNVITPIGEVLTAQQWIDRYPMAGVDGIDIIIGGGTINGSVCMEYTQTIDIYTKNGCDFSECTTKQECLDAMEAWEDAQAQMPPVDTVTAEDRIAAALEAQVMLQMDDVEV